MVKTKKINGKLRYSCACCLNYTLKEEPNGSYEICEVCYWEQDNVQERDENYTGGANKLSLKDSKKNYKAFGAIELRFKTNVRKPKTNELSP